MSRLILMLIVVAGSFSTVSTASAGTASEFDAAYTAASQAEQQAGILRNQWLPTETALKAAAEAAGRKDYDAAIALAREAQALAAASIEQARSEAKLWQNAVVK
jgi:hypothetical protein